MKFWFHFSFCRRFRCSGIFLRYDWEVTRETDERSMLSLLSLISPMRRNDQTASINKNLKKFLCTLFILLFLLESPWDEAKLKDKQEKKLVEFVSLPKNQSSATFRIWLHNRSLNNLKITFGVLNEIQLWNWHWVKHYLHIQLSFSTREKCEAEKLLKFNCCLWFQVWYLGSVCDSTRRQTGRKILSQVCFYEFNARKGKRAFGNSIY